jgi:RND family efflux transporter MFP subunit
MIRLNSNKKIRVRSIGLIAGALVVLSSCGGGEEKNEKLEALESQRDSLKTLITEIDLKIKELDTAAVDNTPVVTAETVQIKDFVHKIEIQGAVETDKNAMVNAEANGTIRVMHVEEGQKVSKGQALMTIDATVLSSQIEEIEAQLDLANYMYEKQKKLMDEGVGTEIAFEQASAQKKSLEKMVKTMKSQEGKTVVRAPFSGVIDEVMVSIGEMAAPGVPLLRIVNNKDVKITASLSESLLSKVFVGTEVELLIPSLNDTIIKSTVSSKGNFIDPVNRTFRIRIKITNNTLLLPNQLAKVNVTDFTRKDAIVINSESILQDTKNNNYVFALKKTKKGKHKVSKVYVNVIKRYKGEACVEPIVNGELTEKSRLVVDGAKGITESDLVNIQ